jgi:hypothetical protein
MVGFGGAPKYMLDKRDNNVTSHCWNLNGLPLENLEQAKLNGTS